MGHKFGKGDLLVASGALFDPNFHRTVVLICEHQEEGSYGLILNRPLDISGPTLKEIPFAAEHAFRGGPVQPGVMQVLHPYGASAGECVEVVPGVWIGGDFELLQEGFRTGLLDPAQCRFFLGYSGWASGQLADEMKADSWLVVKATEDLVFHTPAEMLWVAAVRAVSRDEPIYTNFPTEPSWN